MKKILFLVLTVFALAACQPDNWLPESFEPGSSSTTGGGSGSGSGNGSGSGSSSSANKYTLDQVKKKLVGKWSLNLDDMFFEWYEIQSDMDVNFAIAYDQEAEKNWEMHTWDEGKFTNFNLQFDGEEQFLTVTFQFKCYSYHYDTKKWDEFSSSKKLHINVPALMEENRLYTGDYSIPYERDATNYHFSRPY